MTFVRNGTPKFFKHLPSLEMFFVQYHKYSEAWELSRSMLDLNENEVTIGIFACTESCSKT